MNKALENSIFLPYVFMATGMFFLPHPDKTIVIFFIASTLIALIHYNIKNIKINIKKPIIWALFFLTTYSIFGYYYYPDGSRDIRALLCLLCYFIIFPHEKIKTKHLTYVLFTAGVFSFLNSTYYTYILQLERETGFLNPNVYAGLTGAMTVISLSLLLTNHNKILCSFAFILLLSSTALAQSRTVIFVTLGVSFTLMLLSNKANKKNIIILLSILACTILIFQNQIKDRYNTTINELTELKKGNLDTSMGLRIEMWKYAPSVIMKHPLIGVGGEHRKYLKDAYKNGEISKDLYKFNPPGYHNEIINRMVKNGLIGILLLLSFYVIPIYYGFKQTLEKRLILWGMAGFYIISGATLSPLTQGATILLYGLFVIPYCHNLTLKISSNIDHESKS